LDRSATAAHVASSYRFMSSPSSIPSCGGRLAACIRTRRHAGGLHAGSSGRKAAEPSPARSVTLFVGAPPRQRPELEKKRGLAVAHPGAQHKIKEAAEVLVSPTLHRPRSG
jgi:hypothetical protein